MIPILPPELIYTILESTTFSSNDLTKIALTSCSLLPFARQILYRSIEVSLGKGADGRLLRQVRGGQATANELSTTLEDLLSDPILSPLVRSFRIKIEFGASQEDSTVLLGDAVRGCPNLEVLICTSWRGDSKKLAAIVAKVKHDRLMKAQATRLKVHLEEAAIVFRRQTDPLDLPLSSFRVGGLDQRFAANYLAASASSLRALEVNFSDVHLYQKFTNVSTLFLRQTPLSQPLNTDSLLSTLAHFQRLEALFLGDLHSSEIVTSLVYFLSRLPTTLRSLSLDYYFSPEEAIRLANSLPDNTLLQQLNFRYLSLPNESAQPAQAKEVCRRKGVKLTTGEKWNVWDNLCVKVQETSEESLEIPKFEIIPILPTELFLTVLDSSTFSHHDLTKIALTCRSFLPFARTRLYQFIQLEYYAQINGYALTANPGTNEKSRGALVILRSNRLLRALVKKILIRGDTKATPSMDWSVELIKQLLPICPNVSVFVLKSWEYYPYKLESVFATHERTGGHTNKLAVHFDLSSPDFDMDHTWSSVVPVPLALQSIDTINTKQHFLESILSTSETSLRALGVLLSKVSSYKGFSNIITLHIRQDSNSSGQELYDAIHQFEHLTTLLYDARSSLSEYAVYDIVTVLRQPLPPALSSLSIEHVVDLENAVQLIEAIPNKTQLRQLNLTRLSCGVADHSMLRSLCREKGIRLTFGEVWNLWDQLCTSLYIFTCSRATNECSPVEQKQ